MSTKKIFGQKAIFSRWKWYYFLGYLVVNFSLLQPRVWILSWLTKALSQNVASHNISKFHWILKKNCTKKFVACNRKFLVSKAFLSSMKVFYYIIQKGLFLFPIKRGPHRLSPFEKSIAFLHPRKQNILLKWKWNENPFSPKSKIWTRNITLPIHSF